MRIVLTAGFVFASVAAALAQPAPRLEIGPTTRLDGVFIEGGARTATVVAGVLGRARLTEKYGLEAEVSRAWNPAERSYEGWFVSYAQGSNPTREEIERAAPILRRSLAYTPELGGSAALTIRYPQSPRLSLGARVGVSARHYVETSSHEILSIPEGIDRARFLRDFDRDFAPTSKRRTRGGLLLGADVSFAIAKSLTIVPETRLVYGGPARIGYNHRELGLGVRALWRFM